MSQKVYGVTVVFPGHATQMLAVAHCAEQLEAYFMRPGPQPITEVVINSRVQLDGHKLRPGDLTDWVPRGDRLYTAKLPNGQQVAAWK